MPSFQGGILTLPSMSQFLSSGSVSDPAATQVNVPLAQRQQVWMRLQELSIPSWCTADGQLRVSLSHPVDLLQVWSVVGQFRAPRSEQLTWLERCWQLDPMIEGDF